MLFLKLLQNIVIGESIGLRETAAHILAVGVVSIYSFFSHKYFTFNKGFRHCLFEVLKNLEKKYSRQFMIDNKKQFITVLPIIAIMIIGITSVIFLFDRTLQGDAYSWLQTSYKLYETGETGFQARNILYSYILSIPLFLNIDPINFGLIISGISVILAAIVLYHINQRYASKNFAAFTSFLFIFSYPVLRYGTMLFTDISALFFLLISVFFTIKFYKNNKITYLFIIYISASIAVSLRYASAFYLIAFLYFIWTTRKYYIYHIIGFLLAFFPFIPQIIYNINYLENVYSLSYTAAHPTLSLEYFILGLKGHNFQILSYLKFIFFDFRGILFVFTPFCLYGMIKSFKSLDKKMAVYFVLFFGSILILLSFYAYFSNRYIIPALIPCFIWLNIGLYELYNKIKLWKIGWVRIYIFSLVLSAYVLFDLNFQVVQSSRALHESREQFFTKVNDFIEEGDIIISNENNYITRFVTKKIVLLKPYQLNDEMFNKYSKKNFYLLKTDKKFSSEDGWNNNINDNKIEATFSKIYTSKMKPIKELLLYKILKIIKLKKIIPFEEWHIIKLENDLNIS